MLQNNSTPLEAWMDWPIVERASRAPASHGFIPKLTSLIYFQFNKIDFQAGFNSVGTDRVPTEFSHSPGVATHEQGTWKPPQLNQ